VPAGPPRLALPPYLSETAPEPGRFTSVAVCPRRSPPAWRAARVGYELIGAAMLILAGGGRGFPLDYDEPDTHRVRAGVRSRKGEW
jgi:hypothetical protein